MVAYVGITSSKVKNSLYGILALILIVMAVGGYYYFADRSLFLRIVGLLVLGSLAIALFFKTTLGQSIWSSWLEAVQEVHKMNWPTRQETVQTVVAVFAMVVVMGILLWTADFALLKAVKWLTGHWGV